MAGLEPWTDGNVARRVWRCSGGARCLVLTVFLAASAPACVTTAECDASVPCDEGEICYDYVCRATCDSDDDCGTSLYCAPCEQDDAEGAIDHCFQSDEFACIPRDEEQ